MVLNLRHSQFNLYRNEDINISLSLPGGTVEALGGGVPGTI